MSYEAQRFFLSMVFTGIYSVWIWLITIFREPKSLEIKFADSRKEAALAIGYVLGVFLALAVVLSFLVQFSGGPLGTTTRFDLRRALSQWMVYSVISIAPIVFILKSRKQSFKTVGLTRKNMWLSLGIGITLSLAAVFLSTGLDRSFRMFSWNALYALIYFLAVGFGEELMFRGFLQLRCSIWLGEMKGLILASTIMALVHLPQRIFAVGLSPLEALVSAISLLPISLLMGFFMLRTQNILGPAALHTVVNWVSVV